MAWSAKIMSGSGGTSGVNEFELLYDPASQSEYLLFYDYDLGGEAPDVLYHTPDSGSPIPVRASDRNVVLFLTLHVEGETWDEVLNNITPLARLVDGASSQAVRAQTVGDVDAVVVGIKPDGATYTTYREVLDGFIDTSTAFSSAGAQINTMAYGVTIALTCKPLGYGDKFTLNNALPNSPHMLEDSDGDFLIDGWAENGSVSSTGLSTSIYLIGGQSQFVSTNASSGAGIRSDNVNVADSTDMVAYAWVTHRNGENINVRIRNITDGSTLDNKTVDSTDSGGVSSATAIGTDGRTWYKIVVSGTNSTGGAKDYSLQIITPGAVACSFNVDACYFATGTTTAPAAFASAASIKNRYDPDVDEANINYLDVWGVPGDAPALVDIDYGYDGVETRRLYFFRWHDGKLLAADVPHWIESDDMDDVLSTFSSGTGTTGNHYLRLPSGTSSGFVFFSQTWTAIQNHNVLFIALIRASSTNVTYQLRLRPSAATLGGTEIWRGDEVSPENANQWEIMQLGVAPSAGITTGAAALWPHIYIDNAASQTADIDALLMIPVGGDYEYLLTDFQTYGGDALSYDVYTDAKNESIIVNLLKQAFLGSLWNVVPGSVMNRIVLLTGTSENYDLTTSVDIALTITPRTHHLLGTV